MGSYIYVRYLRTGYNCQSYLPIDIRLLVDQCKIHGLRELYLFYNKTYIIILYLYIISILITNL